MFEIGNFSHSYPYYPKCSWPLNFYLFAAKIADFPMCAVET